MNKINKGYCLLQCLYKKLSLSKYKMYKEEICDKGEDKEKAGLLSETLPV